MLMQQSLEDVANAVGNNGAFALRTHVLLRRVHIDAENGFQCQLYSAAETPKETNYGMQLAICANDCDGVLCTSCKTIENVSRYFWPWQWQQPVSEPYPKFIVQCNCNFQLLFSQNVDVG